MQRLPPCRVCSGKASGLHYGVNTCDACKGFFGRARLRDDLKRCLGNRNCDIAAFRRNRCPSCRYTKCLAVGMSIKAIKTGRYTHKKRTQDTLEIIRLREGNGQEHGGKVPVYFSSPAHSPTPGDDNERLTDVLLESHNSNIKTTFSTLTDEMVEREQHAYYDQYRFNRYMFGPSIPLANDQHEEVFKTTEISLNNHQDMMEMFASDMECDIRQYIKFMKSVPHFQMLSADDKANLIKSAAFEFLFLGSYPGYNNKLKILSTSSGKCLHIQEVCKLWDEDFMLAVFNFSDSLKSLNLSQEECVLTKTIVVFFRDRCELQNPHQVEGIQWKMICALLRLISRKHPRPYSRFAKILDRLTELRTLTEWNKKIVKNLCKWPAVRKRPLLLEMLAI